MIKMVLTESETVDYTILHDAFMATCKKRGTLELIPRFERILIEIRSDSAMQDMWHKYKRDNFYVGELSWEDVNDSVFRIKKRILP